MSGRKVEVDGSYGDAILENGVDIRAGIELIFGQASAKPVVGLPPRIDPPVDPIHVGPAAYVSDRDSSNLSSGHIDIYERPGFDAIVPNRLGKTNGEPGGRPELERLPFGSYRYRERRDSQNR